MVEKISKKTLSAVFLMLSFALFLCACMSPVNIGSDGSGGFFDDDDVKELIDWTKVAVRVDDQTKDKGLVGRKKRIEGLKDNKYYMVQQQRDPDKKPVDPSKYPKYVTEFDIYEGELVEELGLITMISGKIIYGLEDLHTYTVRDALPFAKDTEFNYSDSLGSSDQKATVDSNGKITISARGNITLKNLNNLYNNHKVMAVAVTPSALLNTSEFSKRESKTIGTGSGNVTEFKLEGTGTTVDYVFVDNTNPENFKVLRIEITQASQTVIIDTTNSVSGLTAGDGKISGLSDNNYYMIKTEKDEDGGDVAGGPWYINGSGSKSVSLKDISRVSGGEITGLQNFHTYTVKAALPFAKDIEFKYSDSVGSDQKATVDSNGKITISARGSPITLKNLSTAYNGYSVMAVAIIPSSLPLTSEFASGSKTISNTLASFKLEGTGTTVDYVFVDNTNPANFKVLRIEITQADQKVIITGSPNYLTAGNTEISGLKQDKYYMIEKVKDENDTEVTGSPEYISSNGTKSDNLKNISFVSGGKITGLTNFCTYKISEAVAFPNNTSFTYNDDIGSNTPSNVTVTNGEITISAKGTNITLKNLSPAYNGYKVMAVAVPPSSLPSTSEFTSGSKTISNTLASFKLEGIGTTVDYVFADNANSANFKVLRVVITRAPEQGVAFTLTFDINDGKPILNSSSGILNLGDYDGDIEVKITITNSGFDSIEWYYNGISTTITEDSFVLDNNNANNYLVIGKHKFTIVGKKGDEVYSVDFTLEVKE